MKISEIKSNPKNPRLIKDDKFLKLVNSIKDFPKMMELRPIIIDENNMVLGGNMRLKALKELKYKEISDNWIKKANELTEEEKKEFIIKDNSGFGEWDFDILANEWDTDKLVEWGVDVPIISIEYQEEIKEMQINGYNQTHVLISFPPEKMIEIQEYLQIIQNIEGVEYEQSSN